MSELPHPANKAGLREVDRTIVSIYILSLDDCMILGRQDPSRGGTYPDALRIPGGGVLLGKDGKPTETPDEAIVREGEEEVIGLDLVKNPPTRLAMTAKGAAEKTVEGERVWQRMNFLHYEVRLGQVAAELHFKPGDDLVELGWYSRAERARAPLIPVGRDLMIRGGYIDRPVAN